MRILSSDENVLALMVSIILKTIECGAVDRADANKNGGIKQRPKFPEKIMVRLGGCSKDITTLVILDERTVEHTVFIKCFPLH